MFIQSHIFVIISMDVVSDSPRPLITMTTPDRRTSTYRATVRSAKCLSAVYDDVRTNRLWRTASGEASSARIASVTQSDASGEPAERAAHTCIGGEVVGPARWAAAAAALTIAMRR